MVLFKRTAFIDCQICAEINQLVFQQESLFVERLAVCAGEGDCLTNTISQFVMGVWICAGFYPKDVSE